MHIVVINSSMRPESQSCKVANYLEARLHAHGTSAEILDLFELQLPQYDDSGVDSDQKSHLLDVVGRGDGYVFISPEWNGMMSYGLINMLHYIGKQLADKPVLLAGVSNTRGGYYPVAQMQQMGQKNKHYVILPEHLVLSNIKDFMNDPHAEPQEYIEKRADYALRLLTAYAHALIQVRESGALDYETYANGM